MAEATRFKDLQDAQRKLEQLVQAESLKWQASNEKFQETFHTHTSKVDDQMSSITGKLEHVTHSLAALQLQLLLPFFQVSTISATSRYFPPRSTLFPKIRIPRATTFERSSLSLMDPKHDMKFAIAVDIKRTPRYLANQSVVVLNKLVLRSSGSFITTANNVRVTALREKYLLGNQSLLLLKPLKTSAAIARVHTAEAAAMYMPTHGIAPSRSSSMSSLNLFMNL